MTGEPKVCPDKWSSWPDIVRRAAGALLSPGLVTFAWCKFYYAAKVAISRFSFELPYHFPFFFIAVSRPTHSPVVPGSCPSVTIIFYWKRGCSGNGHRSTSFPGAAA